jgi:hypothetical protein
MIIETVSAGALKSLHHYNGVVSGQQFAIVLNYIGLIFIKDHSLLTFPNFPALGSMLCHMPIQMKTMTLQDTLKVNISTSRRLCSPLLLEDMDSRDKKGYVCSHGKYFE